MSDHRKVFKLFGGRRELRVAVYEKANMRTLLIRWVVTDRGYNEGEG